MQYKTIVLEMLQDRMPYHEELRRQYKLLSTMEKLAKELKASHEAIKEDLQKAHPDSSPQQISSEAFELALKELEDRLPPVSPISEEAGFSLDGAMAFIRGHTQKK